MTPEDITLMKAILRKPFPKSAIAQRKGGGGKTFDYIEAQTVIRRLNEATDDIQDATWSFKITDKEWVGDVLITYGRLSISGLGKRDATGVQKYIPGSGEDLLKGSATDCLKKCATLFGVALDLYGDDYEQIAEDKALKTAERSSSNGKGNTSPSKTDAAMGRQTATKPVIGPRPWDAATIKHAVQTKANKALTESPGTASMATDEQGLRHLEEMLTGVFGQDSKLHTAILNYLFNSETKVINEAMVFGVEKWYESFGTAGGNVGPDECRALKAQVIREGIYVPAEAQAILDEAMKFGEG